MSNVVPSSGNKPHVGIFWGVKDDKGAISLLVDATSLEDAEPYGSFLTHSRGHFDVWESWRGLKPSEAFQLKLPAAVAENEYEFFPRGRIVYHAEKQYFIIYADPRLQTRALVAQIIGLFGLEGASYTVNSDLHYQSPDR
jgi:hypothetical protein